MVLCDGGSAGGKYARLCDGRACAFFPAHESRGRAGGSVVVRVTLRGQSESRFFKTLGEAGVD